MKANSFRLGTHRMTEPLLVFPQIWEMVSLEDLRGNGVVREWPSQRIFQKG